MSLPPNLDNELRLRFSEIMACSTAARELGIKAAKTDGAAAKMMYQMARDLMNDELEYQCKLLRNKLNDHYAKHNRFSWNPSDNVTPP